MQYKSPPVGNIVVAGLYGVKPELLSNNPLLEQYLTESLQEDNFTIVGSASHPFEPQGFTTTKILEESGAEIHTYPEEEYRSIITLLYSCRGSTDARRSIDLFIRKVNPQYSKILVDTQIPVNLLERFLETEKILKG